MNNFIVSAQSNDYFYGTTKLFGSSKKRDIVSNKCLLKHSLLLFRGQIFEWGKSYNGVTNRRPGDCKITWTWTSKEESRCPLSDAKTWAHSYKNKYGKYHLLKNNCHYFVNRLGHYLQTNCGRKMQGWA